MQETISHHKGEVESVHLWRGNRWTILKLGGSITKLGAYQLAVEGKEYV